MKLVVIAVLALAFLGGLVVAAAIVNYLDVPDHGVMDEP